MAYTPKTYNKPAAPAQPQAEATQGAQQPDRSEKVAIAGSIHVTAAGSKEKGERLCNLFLNEKNGKKWLSGKDKEGNRFTVFLNS